MTDIDKVNSIIEHIKRVQNNGFILGNKIIENGDLSMGKMLISNILHHDSSKFGGLEFDSLNKDAEKEDLKNAIYHHSSTNFHHPEVWNGVANMPDIFIAEFTCDTLARAQECAEDYLDWLTNIATKKYNFNTKSKFYKKCVKYYNLIIDNPFKK